MASLSSIKGLNSSQIGSLSQLCSIATADKLLEVGKTPGERKVIADKLGVDRRYVDLWVKQADMLRVQGMTGDQAFILVAAGIRSVSDLAEVDYDYAKRAVKAVSNAHPEYKYDEASLDEMMNEAEKMTSSLEFDDADPEPKQLYAGGSTKGIKVEADSFNGTMTFTSGDDVFQIELPEGYKWESTTSFKMTPSDGGTGGDSDDGGNRTRPTGRVDHPGMTGGGSGINSGTHDSSNNSGNNSSRDSNGNSSTRPTGRVDHPGMTGGGSGINSGTHDSSNNSGNNSSNNSRGSNGNSSPRPTGRVDHPGMTGGSSNSGSGSNSGSNSGNSGTQRGSTGRRR